MTDYAAALRSLVTECPNGCPGELVETVHADGIRLTCTECGFYADEAYAQRRMIGEDDAPPTE